MIGLFFI